ncbi:protein FAR1-RELATED SEQUENCE 5-like [Arachis duranensis]|uniref:Protein FAR1-RELATED SEQUENCE 5-like n=1 Tax=Arachis duranensis TaxID=130453 RepID=A0A6P4CCR5_ARADU|nr:protein FAR1-RELATED SEQUENCE 5-like [Arachis duranensis]
MKDVGLWTISKVVLNHSYPCCPDQAEMLKQYRKLSMFVRRTIETHEEARIRPSKTYQLFVAVIGSHCELSFIEKDVRNYITRKVRNISKEDDAKEFGKYLVRMKEKNQNFFLELNLEGDHCIKHAFWVNATSRAAFDYFGDVVLFDTTYNTNRAIELCMPTTIHRWCIWHIMKKIPSKLNSYKGHIDIEQEMSHVVWNSYTKDAFDRNWNDFLTKYGFGDNKWLSELYEDRHIWIPIYLDHHFWAGMRSTQRSKSIHSFFNKFITRNSSLRQFVKQYDNCLASREQAEREFDAVDFHTVIPCATKSALEWHNICEFASESEELTKTLHRAFDKVMVEMEEYQERRKGKSLLTHEEATLSTVNDLQSPPRVKTRGRPKNRLGSNLEKRSQMP